ncbi:hypothetical protein GW933_03125 [Candidatus Falkowbacteria bacterium]|nr:hypothetical protein [Candidatus Falkowbacteria bacterium]
MKYNSCPHAPQLFKNVLFKLIQNDLVVIYWCDKCNGEFNRRPTSLEILEAKNLGIIK